LATLTLTADKTVAMPGDTVNFVASLLGGTPSVTTGIDLKYESTPGVWATIQTVTVTLDGSGNATANFALNISATAVPGNYNIKATAGGTLDSNIIVLTITTVSPPPTINLMLILAGVVGVMAVGGILYFARKR